MKLQNCHCNLTFLIYNNKGQSYYKGLIREVDIIEIPWGWMGLGTYACRKKGVINETTSTRLGNSKCNTSGLRARKDYYIC